jgi:NAD(P)-dependent dehydrogenase (short-subunit alcohol dehydrogenase family)
MDHFRKTVILSISSDIGKAIGMRRLKQGACVTGTYRTDSSDINELRVAGAKMVIADFTNKESIDTACRIMTNMAKTWDELIVAPGTLEPIGNFEDIDFDDWSTSFSVNFLNQLRAVQKLLNCRNKGASVLFFAGGGTNSAADRFSAYTASKIALIKMTELLDSEIKDAKFSILGPGWIKTKIHNQTIKAKEDAGSAYVTTIKRMENSEFGSIEELLDCMDWIYAQPKKIVGGRNISFQQDKWKSDLAKIFESDPSAGKLRRHANNKLSC